VWIFLPPALGLLLIALMHAAPEFYGRYVAPEMGLVEIAQVLLIGAAAVSAGRLLSLPAVRRERWLGLWVGLALVGCVYVAGEEVSWGQHLFGWTAPEGWATVNDQGETNLHNVTSWLDQKPRTLLEIGVVVGGLILPLLGRPAWLRRRPRIAFLVPPAACMAAAAMAEFRRLDTILFEGTVGEAGVLHRGSEFQELFFYVFVLFYLMALRARIEAGALPSTGD